MTQPELSCHRCGDPDVFSELSLCADCYVDLVGWLDDEDLPEVEAPLIEDQPVSERYL